MIANTILKFDSLTDWCYNYIGNLQYFSQFQKTHFFLLSNLYQATQIQLQLQLTD